MTRRFGARSVWGAMSAYTKAGVVALVLLALALWASWGGAQPPRPSLALPAELGWSSASVTAVGGPRVFEVLRPGERLEVPPGEYEVTLVDEAGLTRRVTIRVDAPGTEISERPRPAR